MFRIGGPDPEPNSGLHWMHLHATDGLEPIVTGLFSSLIHFG